jgi:hypothetical protein
LKFGKNLLKNSENLNLSKIEIAKIHGREAMLYAAIGEKEKLSFELKLTLETLDDKEKIVKYIKHIVPSIYNRNEFKELITNSIKLSEDDKKIIIPLIPKKKSLKDKEEKNVKKEEPLETKKDYVPKEVIIDTSIRKEKADIKLENKKSSSIFKPKKEIYKVFLETADKLFDAKKYEEAEVAYNNAREIAPPDLLKSIDRKKFSIYFQKNKEKLKYASLGIILSLFLLLLYFVGFFKSRNDDYGLISPTKVMAKGMKFIEKEKWNNAIIEFSKIPEASLKREESAANFLFIVKFEYSCLIKKSLYFIT